MGQTGHKILLVLAFSVERMIAVCYPFLVRSTLCFRFRGRSPASRAKHICFLPASNIFSNVSSLLLRKLPLLVITYSICDIIGFVALQRDHGDS